MGSPIFSLITAFCAVLLVACGQSSQTPCANPAQCKAGETCTNRVCQPSPDGGGVGGGAGGGVGGGTDGGVGGGADGGVGGGADGGVGGGADGGVGGGADGGSEPYYDGGTTISAIKGAPLCSQKVTVRNVVITSVANSIQGALGDYNSQFWVADPVNLSDAIFVDKFFTDPSDPAMTELQVGMRVDVEGYTFKQFPFTDRTAYRLTLKNQFDCRKFDGGFYIPADPVRITIHNTGPTPTAPTAPIGFGNAMAGSIKPNPEFGSARIYVPGPLSITNHSPPAFKRVSAIPNDSVFFGFEVTGGILVNNFKTFDRALSDGGLQVRCDYRKMMLDGGNVMFPNGITAAYDTYAHAPCVDGGTVSNCRKNPASVPSTANDYTYVLYPMDCTELVGQYTP